jgi:hypothetical protein
LRSTTLPFLPFKIDGAVQPMLFLFVVFKRLPCANDSPSRHARLVDVRASSRPKFL